MAEETVQRSFTTIVMLGMLAVACGRNRQEAVGGPSPDRDTPSELTVDNRIG
jgi:hypothetical protein